MSETRIIASPFSHTKDVDFFLRVHGHLPDEICGASPIGQCVYAEGDPINILNQPVAELRQSQQYREKEAAILEKQKAMRK